MSKRKRTKKLKNKSAIDNKLIYLIGKHKAELFRYCLKNPRFYQAQAAFDLGWHISTAQFHLKNFTKYGFLEIEPTRYKTYYYFNPDSILKLFKTPHQS